MNLTQRAYHGGEFTGNDCRDLLKKKSLDELARRIPRDLIKFLRAFHTFGGVVESCFSQTLQPGYQDKISLFQKEYLSLGVSVIPKAHIVFLHIKDFIESRDGPRVGLGVYSEQAFEALHRDFLKVWQRFQVSHLNPNFGTKLLKAVQFYNSRHQAKK